jgi:hypothetical protein
MSFSADLVNKNWHKNIAFFLSKKPLLKKSLIYPTVILVNHEIKKIELKQQSSRTFQLTNFHHLSYTK